MIAIAVPLRNLPVLSLRRLFLRSDIRLHCQRLSISLPADIGPKLTSRLAQDSSSVLTHVSLVVSRVA